MAWIAYLIALILVSNEIWIPALIVFGIGMVFHWKHWLAAIAVFFVAAGWNKP